GRHGGGPSGPGSSRRIFAEKEPAGGREKLAIAERGVGMQEEAAAGAAPDENMDLQMGRPYGGIGRTRSGEIRKRGEGQGQGRRRGNARRSRDPLPRGRAELLLPFRGRFGEPGTGGLGRL